MEELVKQIIEKQKAFFLTHQTKSVVFRIEQLKRLRIAIGAYEERLYEALWKDLHKSKFEAYATEIGLVMAEIRLHLRKLHSWSKPEKVPTNQMIHFWSTSRIIKEPYGRVLIIAPWNYPFQLLINPLVGAISAGNCITLKASEYTPATAQVMGDMIREYFPPEYIACFGGGRESNLALLAQQWDYIFFTGSPMVGKIVMESAARHLTPVSLELGGKSPCIVDRDANLEVAANRIVWGKFLNAGQTCIAPDYLFVHCEAEIHLLELIKERIRKYFGEDPYSSPDFPRIATIPKTERLAAFLDNAKIITGGQVLTRERYIAPTVIKAEASDPIMQEEIFGPILPVMTFCNRSEVIDYVNARPKPLAFYYFSNNKESQEEMLLKTSSGGGCINEVIMHIANDKMPFGGVGNSGMGRYHGKFSFDVFSHQRAIMKKSLFADIPLRYPPYGDKWKLIKMVMR